MSTKENLSNGVIADFTKGSEIAFKEIYTFFYPILTHFAYKLTSSLEEAEDIVSEVFIKLHNRRQVFDSFVNIRAFLYISVRNNCFNYLKYQQRKANQQKEFIARLDMDSELENEQIFLETLRRIYEAVENLPPQCKRIFKMYYYEEMDSTKIAELLNLSVNTVRVQKKRALEILRIVLTENQLLLACTLFLHFPNHS